MGVTVWLPQGTLLGPGDSTAQKGVRSPYPGSFSQQKAGRGGCLEDQAAQVMAMGGHAVLLSWLPKQLSLGSPKGGDPWENKGSLGQTVPGQGHFLRQSAGRKCAQPSRRWRGSTALLAIVPSTGVS